MKQPTVTIVIPTYNRGHYLEEAIQSTLNQTFSDFELIISDDASTDNTTEVVQSFNDPRIHYHRHAANLGITENWQFVVSKASSAYIAPLADDDLYLPDHLATGLAILKDYPDAAYYTCPAKYFGYDHGIEYYRPAAIADTETPVLHFFPEQAKLFLGLDSPGPMNSMICRREVFQQDLFWGPPGYLPQDLVLMPQLMVQGGFVFSNEAKTMFRVHETNTSLASEKKTVWKFNCMSWYGVRWVTQFLLDKQLCTLADIEIHGRQSEHYYHVVPLVLALASFDAPSQFRVVANHIFQSRTDMDQHSVRFQLARRFGFWIIPVLEKITQLRVGWWS